MHPATKCENVVQGHPGDWATDGEGTGAWIQLNFDKDYTIDQIDIKHRSNGMEPEREMFKDVSIAFPNGKNVNFTLNNIPFTKGLVWNKLKLPKKFVTDQVKITALSVHNIRHWNNGFSDIRFYGPSEGKSSLWHKNTYNMTE